MFWIVLGILVLAGLEWMAVERFISHVQELVADEEFEEAMTYLIKWHWLASLDPILHDRIHEMQQRIMLAQHQQGMDRALGEMPPELQEDMDEEA